MSEEQTKPTAAEVLDKIVVDIQDLMEQWSSYMAFMRHFRPFHPGKGPFSFRGRFNRTARKAVKMFKREEHWRCIENLGMAYPTPRIIIPPIPVQEQP